MRGSSADRGRRLDQSGIGEGPEVGNESGGSERALGPVLCGRKAVVVAAVGKGLLAVLGVGWKVLKGGSPSEEDVCCCCLLARSRCRLLVEPLLEGSWEGPGTLCWS